MSRIHKNLKMFFELQKLQNDIEGNLIQKLRAELENLHLKKFQDAITRDRIKTLTNLLNNYNALQKAKEEEE